MSEERKRSFPGVMPPASANHAPSNDNHKTTASAKSISSSSTTRKIKMEFDENHGPTWHCIVGKNFGSYVTHETNHFVYFYLDSKAVLLFKSG